MLATETKNKNMRFIKHKVASRPKHTQTLKTGAALRKSRLAEKNVLTRTADLSKGYQIRLQRQILKEKSRRICNEIQMILENYQKREETLGLTDL